MFSVNPIVHQVIDRPRTRQQMFDRFDPVPHIFFNFIKISFAGCYRQLFNIPLFCQRYDLLHDPHVFFFDTAIFFGLIIWFLITIH